MSEVSLEYKQYLGKKFAVIIQKAFEKLAAEPGSARNIKIFIGGGEAKFKLKEGNAIYARRLLRRVSQFSSEPILLYYEIWVDGEVEIVLKKYSCGALEKNGYLIKSN